MKYGKHFVDEIINLPDLYKNTSINYKKWKQEIKEVQNTNDSIERLESSCKLIDELFVYHSELLYQRGGNICFPLTLKSYKTFAKENNFSVWQAYLNIKRYSKSLMNMETLIKFAEINNTTVYKVCKKIDKQTKTNEGRLWLIRNRDEKKYKFMSGILLTRLRLDIANQIQECPICMDVMGNKNNKSLILNCGHAICLSCIYKLTGIRNNGTLYNLLLTVDSRILCPLCIKRNPFRDISELSLWKKTENSINLD